MCRVQRREQRDGHAEHHGVEVGEERRRENRPAADEAQPLGHCPQSWLHQRVQRWHGRHPAHAVQRGAEAQRVDQVAHPQAGRGSDDAGQQHPGKPADLDGQVVERNAGGQPLGGQQPLHERPPGGVVDRHQQGLYRGKHVEQPELAKTEERLRGEDRRDRGQAAARNEDEPTPVHGVGERPADQPKGEDGDELDDPDRADSGRGPGEVVDLQHHGETRHRAADGRQGRSRPQAAERRGLPQRPDVSQQAPG
jgi:hypothetical protein